MTARITARNGRILDVPQAACWSPFWEGDRQGTKPVAGTLWERLANTSEPQGVAS